MGKPKGHPNGKRKKAGHRKDGQKTGTSGKERRGSERLKGSVKKSKKSDVPVAMDADAQVSATASPPLNCIVCLSVRTSPLQVSADSAMAADDVRPKAHKTPAQERQQHALDFFAQQAARDRV
jgi:hypothetical protein